MKLVLVRHTTTHWNTENRLQGHTDIPLNEVGYREAKELAEAIALIGISQIISSDLKRALQTAEIIQKRLQIPLIVDERLRECRFGDLEGMLKDDVKKYHGSRCPDLNAQYDQYDFSPFGGESRDDVLLRYLEVLEECKKTHSNETILLVGHGRSLNTLLCALGFSINIKTKKFCIIEF